MQVGRKVEMGHMSDGVKARLFPVSFVYTYILIFRFVSHIDITYSIATK